MRWVTRFGTDAPVRVLDLGGRDVNGTPRSLFPNAVVYRVLDIADGPGVDVIANAATWTPDGEYDVVLSTECFEHAAEWPRICATAFKALAEGGLFVATMAGPGRPVHSGVDGGPVLYAGEHYGNVDPDALRAVLAEVGFTDVTVDQQWAPCDVRCAARKARP